jgi:hypothetical protein
MTAVVAGAVAVGAFSVAAVFFYNFAAVFADAVNITYVTATSALVIPVAIVYCRTSHSCHSYCCGCFLVATAAAAAAAAVVVVAAAAAAVVAAAATMAILLDDDGATKTAVGVAVSTTVFFSQRLLLYDIVNQLPNF